MSPRAKVNRRFWVKLRSMMYRMSDWGAKVDAISFIRREIARVRVDAYARGFNEGVAYMSKRLSGKYGND